MLMTKPRQYLSDLLFESPLNKILEPFPREVHLALTNRCNLSCKFCGQAQDKWCKDDELGFDHYKEVIDQIAAMKNRSVSFCGGEVYLYSDFDRLLEYCHRKGVTISMVLTNGILLNERRINSLIDYQVRHVGFSIDGIGDSHDEIRGLKGAYEKTVAAIKTLNAVKTKRGTNGPTVGINFVITNRTISGMEAAYQVATELEVNEQKFSHLNYITGKRLLAHKEYMRLMYPDYDFCYWDGFINNNAGLDADRLTNAMRRIEQQSAKQGLKASFYHDLDARSIDKWYNSDETVFNKCCFFKHCFLVLPNGDYPLCDYVRYPIGNIKERLLEDLWSDNRAREFRKSLRKKLVPGCERCCSLCSS